MASSQLEHDELNEKATSTVTGLLDEVDDAIHSIQKLLDAGEPVPRQKLEDTLNDVNLAIKAVQKVLRAQENLRQQQKKKREEVTE